jgi:hypothetical protein
MFILVNSLLYYNNKSAPFRGASVRGKEPLAMAATYPAVAGHHMRSALNPHRRQGSVYSGF